jgi:hypothetical protein
MSAALRQEGEYRGSIIEYGLIEKKNDRGEFGGLSLFLKIAAEEVWMVPQGETEPQWLDCHAWDGHGEGYLVLITKAGKPNETQIRSLCRFAGWDGDFESLAARTWQPTPVRFDIRYETFNNTGSYRINWISDYESVPGAAGNVNADRAKQLASQFGGAIRAIAGNAQRVAQPAPAGRPAVPGTRPMPQPRRYANSAAAAAVPAAEGDDIPF